MREFAAGRLGLDAGELTIQIVGYTALATAIAAYEVWLAQPGSVLHDLLDSAFAQVTRGLGAVTQDAMGRRSVAPSVVGSLD
ncbi:MAG: hypothetical protein ABJD68_04700 [Nakamurella sp.]